ncbi:hypothetical protein TSUD_246270 [Trifolium subterraneum]|uniref:Uncharacterized protein n=1 Tax=Trifolium subterraneum TaxID=3900 RepID=A0A2Z6NKE2_TRISU|nr:hypothetical protein TSUD_246270 [Trifolium subterraneum]
MPPGETQAGAEDPLLELVTPVEPKMRAIEQEPMLGGWFRGNCKFRSPMLQLHIGIELKHI